MARSKVIETLDGKIIADGLVFESWQAYANSDFFRAQGKRCGTVSRPGPAPAGGSPDDCTFTLTNPTPVYDPSVARYTIPVVVHVIQNTSGSGFISAAMVQSQIDILNEDLLALVGTNGESGTNIEIEFHLATEDPSGSPTNGITYSTDNTWFNDGGSYWNTLAWDTNRYLNIYTNTAGGFLGYVPDLPQGGIAGSNADRVVILWSSFGRNGPIGPPFDQGRTTTHEVGHYFGLEHTFTGGCSSPSACYASGDLICDTNAQANPTSGCGDANSCSTPDPFHNYMDYSDDLCMEEFTPEQARRMRCSVEHYRPDVYGIGNVECGNGVVEAGEQCDDGNTTPGDGCDENCQYEHTCGDGVIEPGEECDDGNTTPGDGCDANCQSEPVCGNGVIEAGEQCDDGNNTPGDGCDAGCQIESIGHNCCETGHGAGCSDPTIESCVCAADPFCCDVEWDQICADEVESLACGSCTGSVCGNGIVETGEQCDDGNTASGDGCDGNCQNEFCGDGMVNNAPNEQCDDGNTASGDGCNENCQLEKGACAQPMVTAGISSRYIRIDPDPGMPVPVAFRIECGTVTEWARLAETGYDDGGGVFVNIGTGVADCASADFLTPDQWSSNGANALYVTGLAIAPNSRPTVTAVCIDCAGAEANAVRPADPTWVFCDSSNDGQVTFFMDLFKQFANTAANGFPLLTGPDPGIEVDTQGDSPTRPDQQVTFFGDIFACFSATAAGGGATWTGGTCP
ncbi:MAG: DUF4215 domain-containing protein [Phycisphaerae bacterium]